MTTLWRVGSVLLLALVLGDSDWASRAEGQVTAEKPLDAKGERQPVDYQPIFQQAWQKQGRKPVFYAWEGEKVVLLTSSPHLDPKTIDVFLKRLDAAWKLCDEITGHSPQPYKQHKGKPTIAAIPDPKLMANIDHYGIVGGSGGEVSTFDGADGDYERVRKAPEQFPTGYFRVIAQNHYGAARSCLAFHEGATSFLRDLCVEDAKVQDDEPKSSQLTEAANAYAKSNFNIGTSFTHLINSQPMPLKDSAGQPMPTKLGMLLGSIALELRRERGGNEWLKRFYRHLASCPVANGLDQSAVQAQLLNFTIAASLASQSEPSKDFQTRCRFPFDPAVWSALKQVDWKKPGLTAMDVIDALPSEHVLPSIVQLRPSFLTPERRKQNLLVASDFEGDAAKNWRPFSWRLNGPYAGAKLQSEVVKEGRQALHIKTTESDDIRFEQTVKLQPGTRYMLSGWIKTKDVTFDTRADQTYRRAAASLSIWGGYEHTQLIVGTNDWQYVTLTFDSNTRSEVSIGARLGYWYSIAHGEAWFDDLRLIPLGPSPVRPGIASPPPAPGPAAKDNLLVNGSFEEGPNIPDSFGYLPNVRVGSTDIKGWTVTRGSIDIVGSRFWNAGHGQRSIDLHGTPGFGGIKQSFKTAAGQRYQVSFLMAGTPQEALTSFKLAVRAADKQQEFSFDATGKTRFQMGWTRKTWDFVATATETSLEIHTLQTAAPNFGPIIDDVSVIALGVGAPGQPLKAEAEETPTKSAEVPRKASNDQSALTLKGSPFTSVAYSHDGKWIATAAINRSVTLWDAEKAQPVRVLDGGWCVAFSPDSQQVASAGPGNSVRVWNVTSGTELKTLNGHTGDVRSVAFNRDGTQIASASADKTVRLWDTQTGQLLKTFEGHTDGVRAVVFSPEAKRLVSASKDRTVRVWPLDDRGQLRVLTGHTAEVRTVEFCQDLESILSAGHDSTVRHWAGFEGGLIKEHGHHGSGVMSLAICPDLKWVATAGSDRLVKISNLKSGREQASLSGHTSQVTGVAWHPLGKRLASVSYDGTLKLWDVAETLSKPAPFSLDEKSVTREISGEESKLIEDAGKTSRPLTNGNLATGDLTGWTLDEGAKQFRLFKLPGGQQTALTTAGTPTDASMGRLYQCFKVPADATELRFFLHGGADSQGTYVALWKGMNEVRRAAGRNDNAPINVAWNIESLRGQVVTIEVVDQSTAPWGFIGVHGFEIHAQQKNAAWPRTGKKLERITETTQDDSLSFTLRGHAQPVVGLALSPDGKLLASGDQETVFVWDIPNRTLKYEVLTSGINGNAMAFSPDGKWLAKSFLNAVHLHEASTGNELKSLSGHSAPVSSICFSPDGKLLASASHDMTVKVWDVAQGKLVTTLTGLNRISYSTAFSPDGKWLAVGSSIWSTSDWKQSRSLSPIQGEVLSAAFRPNQPHLVTTSDSGRASIWDVSTGEEVFHLKDRSPAKTQDHMQQYHEQQLRSVACSEDGSRIATAAESGSVKIWDTRTSQKLHTLKAHQNNANVVLFDPDGKWLASGGGDHLVKVWTLEKLPKEESTDDTIMRPLVDAKAVAEEIKLLQGTWRMTNLADYADLGVTRAPLRDVQLEIKDELAMLVSPELAFGFQIALDPTRTPKACDLVTIDLDSNMDLWKGSYKLEGDSLVIVAQNPQKQRPVKFDAPKFDGASDDTPPLLFKFQRQKSPLSQSSPMIDWPVWQKASKQLRTHNVSVYLDNMSRVRTYGVTLPPFVGYCDLTSAMTDGTVTTEVWNAASSVNVLACSVKSASDATLRQLSTHRGLTGLTLQGPSTITKDGVALLKNCPQLVSLSFNECPQTIEILNALPATTDLRLMAILGATTPSALFTTITRFKNLEVLNLSDIDLSDDSALEIAKLTNLKLLTSYKSKQPNNNKPELSDKGLQALGKMPKLMSVELHGHDVDSLKLQQLHEKLRARQ